ncbi:cytochrome c oxidase subunit II [Sphingomonas flavalba]|uniref:cytochrome c oxidase subunit II n=1 Tax=Sphingomonas flavalba TaxID=2559804 RepID=UPI0039DF8551
MIKFTPFLLAFGLIAASAATAQPAPAPAPVAPATVAAPAPITPVATPAADAPAAAESQAVEAPAPLLPDPNVGMPQAGSMQVEHQVTPNGQEALWIHDAVLMPVIVAITLLVLVLLVWVMFRYRASANPVPSRTSHHTVIEVIWTLVPVFILLAIAVPSIGLLAAQFKPASKDALTIKVVGNQWYWTYEYPDNGGFEIISNMLKDDVAPGERQRADADGPPLLAVDNRIVMPVGRQIKLIVTSNDVIHSWAIPAFWTKMDAVPGRLNEVQFTVEKEGLYFGQCSELCGARHGFMPIAVEVVSPERFAQWVRSKGGTMPEDAPAAAETPAAEAPAAVAAAPAEAPAAAPSQAATANSGN